MGSSKPRSFSKVYKTLNSEDVVDLEMVIGGVKVNYFFHCKTQLWLFSHFITQEHESELVLLGKIIEETSFRKMRMKNVIIDQKISIDFVKKGDYLVLYDIKKSSKFRIAHFYQLTYYLWYLKKLKGIEKLKGFISYPKEHKRVEVDLTLEMESKMENILRGIQKVTSLPKPPKPKRRKFCEKCSYFEFCWINK